MNFKESCNIIILYVKVFNMSSKNTYSAIINDSNSHTKFTPIGNAFCIFVSEIDCKKNLMSLGVESRFVMVPKHK